MSGAIYVVLLISSLLGANSLPRQDNFGIIGGSAVNISEVPFMARYCPAMYNKLCCGAAIISESYLITSAECYYGIEDLNRLIYRRSPTIAIVGTDQSFDDDGEVYEIEEVYPHPHYYHRRQRSPQPVPVPVPVPEPVPVPPYLIPQGNNVAVLKLAKKLRFNANVQAIKLADESLDISEGAMMETMGFGSTSTARFDVRIPRQLQKVSVPFVTPEKCRRTFPFLTDTMVCAGSQYIGSSYFDEGGPLVYEGQLVGILTEPRTVGYKNVPSIYTYIPAVRDFIDAMTQSENKP